MSRDIYQHIGVGAYCREGKDCGDVWMEFGEYKTKLDIRRAFHGSVMMGWSFATN